MEGRMKLEEIDVTIDADGRVHIEVRGAKGGECLDLTRPLEEGLGGQVEERRMTPEAYEQTEDQAQPNEEKRRAHKR